MRQSRLGEAVTMSLAAATLKSWCAEADPGKRDALLDDLIGFHPRELIGAIFWMADFIHDNEDEDAPFALIRELRLAFRRREQGTTAGRKRR